jgi:hypothetical protein
VPRPVGESLVLTKPADRSEADLRVGPDRPDVVGGGVDRQAVVSVVLDELTDDRPDRVRTEALAVDCRIEEQIDACMAKLRLGLLVGLDRADQPAVEGDRIDDLVRLVDEELGLDAGEVVGRPPAGDLRRRKNGYEAGRIIRNHRTQGDKLATDLHID